MIASASIQPRPSSVNGLVSIGQASRALGVSQQTLRAASNCGALKTYILPSGHRRYSLGDCYTFLGQGGESPAAHEAKILVYARVSGAKQSKGIARGEASDLSRQIERLTAYCAEHFGCSAPTIYRDTGSGISFVETARPAFCRLMKEILAGEHDGATLVVAYSDRLCRFAFEFVKLVLESHGIKLVVAFDSEDKDDDESLTECILSFVHVFSCRHYARRSAEKLRVTPAADVTKRILELSQAGYAIRAIVARLQSEGLSTDTKGRPITTSVVTRILRESAPIKETIVGVAQTNSFGRFAQQHIKITSDASGLGGEAEAKGPLIQHNTITKHYHEWCKKNGEAPISNGRISRYFKEAGVGGKTHWNGYKVYWGIQLVGLDGQGAWNEQNRNETVRERRGNAP